MSGRSGSESPPPPPSVGGGTDQGRSGERTPSNSKTPTRSSPVSVRKSDQSTPKAKNMGGVQLGDEHFVSIRGIRKRRVGGEGGDEHVDRFDMRLLGQLGVEVVQPARPGSVKHEHKRVDYGQIEVTISFHKDTQALGCEHYQRQCQIVASCCPRHAGDAPDSDDCEFRPLPRKPKQSAEQPSSDAEAGDSATTQSGGATPTESSGSPKLADGDGSGTGDATRRVLTEDSAGVSALQTQTRMQMRGVKDTSQDSGGQDNADQGQDQGKDKASQDTEMKACGGGDGEPAAPNYPLDTTHMKAVGCRFCHDADPELSWSHEIDRFKDIEFMACMVCARRKAAGGEPNADQPPRQGKGQSRPAIPPRSAVDGVKVVVDLQPASVQCRDCGEQMAAYYCDICHFWENDPMKKVYHCKDCGLCRRGSPDNYFHCPACNCCYHKDYQRRGAHKCLTNVLDSNCPICGDYMFTSVEPLHFLDCSHALHVSCLKSYLKHGFLNCPICKRSIGDTSVRTSMIDSWVKDHVMPEEYRGLMSYVLCNDCCSYSVVPYHFHYHKCAGCGGYNTHMQQRFDPKERTMEPKINHKRLAEMKMGQYAAGGDAGGGTGIEGSAGAGTPQNSDGPSSDGNSDDSGSDGAGSSSSSSSSGGSSGGGGHTGDSGDSARTMTDAPSSRSQRTAESSEQTGSARDRLVCITAGSALPASSSRNGGGTRPGSGPSHEQRRPGSGSRGSQRRSSQRSRDRVTIVSVVSGASGSVSRTPSPPAERASVSRQSPVMSSTASQPSHHSIIPSPRHPGLIPTVTSGLGHDRELQGAISVVIPPEQTGVLISGHTTATTTTTTNNNIGNTSSNTTSTRNARGMATSGSTGAEDTGSSSRTGSSAAHTQSSSRLSVEAEEELSAMFSGSARMSDVHTHGVYTPSHGSVTPQSRRCSDTLTGRTSWRALLSGIALSAAADHSRDESGLSDAYTDVSVSRDNPPRSPAGQWRFPNDYSSTEELSRKSEGAGADDARLFRSLVRRNSHGVARRGRSHSHARTSSLADSGGADGGSDGDVVLLPGDVHQSIQIHDPPSVSRNSTDSHRMPPTPSTDRFAYRIAFARTNSHSNTRGGSRRRGDGQRQTGADGGTRSSGSGGRPTHQRTQSSGNAEAELVNRFAVRRTTAQPPPTLPRREESHRREESPMGR